MFVSDPYLFWFITGIFLIILEVFTMSVILLFVGMASITLGAFLFFGFVGNDSHTIQSIIFFSSTVIWYLFLYIPLKKIKIFKLKKGYKNILDQRAQAITVLKKGKVGKVKWSGTRMKAILSNSNFNSTVPKGEIVRIIDVEGNILKVTNNP